MTVTVWPVRSPPPDGAALPPPALAGGVLAPPVLAAGLGEVVPDEQAAANSAAPAMNTAIRDRQLRSSMPFLLSRITGPVVGSCSGAIGWRKPPGLRCQARRRDVEPRTMSSVGSSVRCGIARS